MTRNTEHSKTRKNIAGAASSSRAQGRRCGPRYARIGGSTLGLVLLPATLCAQASPELGVPQAAQGAAHGEPTSAQPSAGSPPSLSAPPPSVHSPSVPPHASNNVANTQVAASAQARVPISALQAVQTTLRRHPQLRVGRAAVGVQKANLEVAKGRFDTILSAQLAHQRTTSPLLPSFRPVPEYDSDISDQTNLNLGASVMNTWGTSIVPSVGLSRIHNRPGANVQVPGLPPTDPYQTAQINLTVTQPLLRGFGQVGAASSLRVAKNAQQASEHELNYLAQRLVYETLLAYFALVAAEESLAAYRQAEAVAERLVSDTRTLAEAEQRPRADLQNLQGNLANRVRGVAQAHNLQIQAQYALGITTGLTLREVANWHPSDELPAQKETLPSAAGAIAKAEAARQDAHAARSTLAAAKARSDGASYNTKPALDLSVSVGYQGGIDDDGVGPFLTSPARNIAGPNAGVALTFELPVANYQRAGERQLAAALQQQAKANAADIERRVPIGVRRSLEQLRIVRKVVQAARDSVEHYASAVQNERTKLREGMGTVIDIILSESLLIQAQQNLIQHRLQYAQALLQLAFEQGALPTNEQELSRIQEILYGERHSSGQ